MAYKNDLKIALLFIALGLILGGYAGMTQSPPPVSGEGWTNEDGMGSDIYCLIPDQNNDTVNDIAVFIRAMEYDATNGSESEKERLEFWNQSAGFEIVSGRDGKLLRRVKLDDPLTAFRDASLSLIYANDSLLFTAVPIVSFDWKLPQNQQYDMKSLQLIKFSLKTMTISKRLNLTGSGLEWIDNFNSTNIVNIGWFQPQFHYLMNLGFTIPGTSYTGDVILHKNNLPFSNLSIVRYSFIDPESLSIMSYVDCEKPYVDAQDTFYRDSIHVVEGPLNELDRGKFYPFVSWIFQQEHGESLDNLPLQISMTSIDNLINYSSCVMNCLNNESLGTMPQIPYDTRVIVNMKNKTTIAGVNIYSRQIGETTNSHYKKVTTQWPYPWAYEVNTTLVQSSRIDIFKIDLGGSVNRTFSDMFNHPSMANSNKKWGVNYGDVIMNVIPIRYQNDANSPTGIALILSDQEQHSVTYDDGDYYPYLNYGFAFINQSVTADPIIADQTFNYGTGSWGTVNASITNNLVNMNDHFIPITFDIDKDGITDVPLVGQLVTERLLLNTAEKDQTGPCVIMQSSTGRPFQAVAYSIYLPMRIVFRSDVNNDKIPDVLLSGTITIYTSLTEPEVLTWPQTQFGEKRKDTQNYFIIGVIMIIAAIVILIIALMQKSSEHLKIRQKWLFILIIASIVMIGILYGNINSISEYAQRANTTQIGMTQKAIAISNLARVGGIGSFVFLTFLPASVGIWILLTPMAADGIIGLNQIMFAKKTGLKAAVKKQSMDEKAIIEETGFQYKILVIPPFGKRIQFKTVLSRALSILFLSVSIGLLIFENLTVFVYDLSGLESITAMTDKAFMDYINALFNLLIVPGIIAVPFFFWLIPTSWLLDDAGVLFYMKSVKNRKPEDVESIAGWFSNYLKGFLGISAIYSYGMFIYESPMFDLYDKLPSDIATTIMIFVFGFIILSGLAFGLILTAFYEIVLPYSANRLYDRLAKRNVDISMTGIEFVNKGKFTDEQVIHGYLNTSQAPKVKTPKESPPNPDSLNDNLGNPETPK